MNKKQNNLTLLVTGFILICFWSMYFQITETQPAKSDFIRFHVIANSNSPEDQNLKLKVRDEIINQISPQLMDKDNAAETRDWLINHAAQINTIATNTLKAENCDLETKVSIGQRWIPEKTYGTITFPAGNYEAFTVEIGEAKGENWWCVMFPPLCVIGDNPEANKKLADNFKDTKYEDITNACAEGSPYVLKFKTIEIGESLRNFIKNN